MEKPSRNLDQRNSEQLSRSSARGFSLSPLATLSPSSSSVIAYDFSFLDGDESPGIPLEPTTQHPPPLLLPRSADGHILETNSATECSASTVDRDRSMSESLVTSIPANINDTTPHAVVDQRLPVVFSSMQSLNSTSDEADDGTQSFVSLDPISVDERLAAATHGSDPMIASMYSRDESLDDIKALNHHQRSFSAEETLCNKENQFDNSLIENGLSKANGQNDSSSKADTENLPGTGLKDTNGFGKAEPLDRTLTTEGDATLVLDAAAIREEEIRRIEEAAYTLTDGVELPRASDVTTTSMNGNDSCVSPPVLLDDSMITLVGTPHPMTYIPMEDVFTFVDRRPNQELPAITEEIEGRSRNSSTDVALEGSETQAAMARSQELESRMIEELDYPYDVEIPPGPLHRRAISDNLGIRQGQRSELHRTQEIEEIDRIGNEDVQMRSQRTLGRASSVVSNRCQSQVFLPHIGLSDTAMSDPVLDRNLSSSDPSVNEEKTSKISECPPPVVLTRKASSIHSESWKKQCATETGPPQATPVQMRTDPVSTTTTAAAAAAARPQSTVARPDNRADLLLSAVLFHSFPVVGSQVELLLAQPVCDRFAYHRGF
ncbi:unnamed protein product [Heligmosomoides polygyrus]|uniref:Protein kinase domain-containing protein n=1 Tax=Heligmosomoides polygyrus TaxID=6339 RepID=A0A3P7XJW5_HELPZ|nr:unnamed protein product [Heligmosomoides polygyrus]